MVRGNLTCIHGVKWGLQETKLKPFLCQQREGFFCCAPPMARIRVILRWLFLREVTECPEVLQDILTGFELTRFVPLSIPFAALDPHPEPVEYLLLYGR